MYVKVTEFLNHDRAISWNDGNKFKTFLHRQYQIISLLEDETIFIDFADLYIVTNSFMSASICGFLMDNKSAIDSIKFIDSSTPNNKVSDIVQLYLDRLIPLALDDRKREAHEKAIDDMMNGYYEPL